MRCHIRTYFESSSSHHFSSFEYPFYYWKVIFVHYSRCCVPAIASLFRRSRCCVPAKAFVLKSAVRRFPFVYNFVSIGSFRAGSDGLSSMR